MLDEFLEYRQYSYSFEEETDEFDRFRLTQRALEKNLTGISRALETVARFQLFHGDPADPHHKRRTPKDPDAVIEDLRQWVKTWLKAYVDRLVEHNDTENGINRATSIKNHISGSMAYWCKHDLLESTTNSRNNFNRITFEKTVAAALEKGPLHKYILIEKKDLFDKVKMYDDKNKPKEKLSPKQKDYILKLTAYFLIENRLNQKSVLLTDINLVNWWINASPNPNSFYLNQEELFEKTDSENGNNFSKYKKNPAWISNYSLLDVTNEKHFQKWLADPVNKGKSYYIDQGSGKPLKKR